MGAHSQGAGPARGWWPPPKLSRAHKRLHPAPRSAAVRRPWHPKGAAAVGAALSSAATKPAYTGERAHAHQPPDDVARHRPDRALQRSKDIFSRGGTHAAQDTPLAPDERDSGWDAGVRIKQVEGSWCVGGGWRLCDGAQGTPGCGREAGPRLSEEQENRRKRPLQHGETGDESAFWLSPGLRGGEGRGVGDKGRHQRRCEQGIDP